jgi:hypothetical protein
MWVILTSWIAGALVGYAYAQLENVKSRTVPVSEPVHLNAINKAPVTAKTKIDYSV